MLGKIENLYSTWKMKNSKTNVKEFEKTERREVTMADFEYVFRQVFSHSDKPKTKSENRETSREEVNRQWELGKAFDER